MKIRNTILTRALYPELATRYGPQRRVTHLVTLYRQPAWRHMLATVYETYTEIITPLAARLEPHFTAGHQLACDDDCGEVITADGDETRACVYIPWTSRQDERCFDLAHDDREDVVEIELTEQQYAALLRPKRGTRGQKDRRRTGGRDDAVPERSA